jgi:transcriptional regulator with XRE-family HTH domain
MIGEEVRRRREELGLTGAELAERANLAPSAVSQIETGKRSPSSNSIVKLAEALGVEVGELFPKKAQAPLQLEVEEQAGQEPGEGRRDLLALLDTQASLMRGASEYYGPRLDHLPEDPPLEELVSKYTWVIDFSFICVLHEESINTSPFAEIAGRWVGRANEEGTPPEIRRSVHAFEHAVDDLLGTRHNQALAWIWKQRERYQKQVEEGHAELAAELFHTFDERLSKTRG